jgi:phage replication-related protein YjqB (UPF0714/DUF867 family)
MCDMAGSKKRKRRVMIMHHHGGLVEAGTIVKIPDTIYIAVSTTVRR